MTTVDEGTQIDKRKTLDGLHDQSIRSGSLSLVDARV